MVTPESQVLGGCLRDFLETVQKLGGLAIVCRGWEELDAELRKAGYVDDGPLFENALPYGGV